MPVSDPGALDRASSERPRLLRAVRRQAHRHGWTAPELFAVHPEHGTLRVDYCGVLMIVAEPARGIEAQRILFDRLTGYRNKVGQIWGIPVWEFAKKGAGR